MRPDSIVVNSGIAVGGAGPGTINGNTADDSLASWVAGTGSEYVILNCSNISIPAGAIIKAVIPQGYYRTSAPYGTPAAYFWQYVTLAGHNYPAAPPLQSAGASLGIGLSSFVLLVGGSVARKFDNTPWTQADLDALQFVFQVHPAVVYGSQECQAAEFYLTVQYNQRPVITPTSPADGAVITDTSRPTVAWSFSDPESDAKESHWVQVFSGTGTATPGSLLSPADAARVEVNTGTIYSAANMQQMPHSLENGSYRWYAAASDAGSNDRLSAWVTRTFTIAIPAPGTPVVTATAETTSAYGPRVAVSISDPAPAVAEMAADYFQVQRSVNGGLTWTSEPGSGVLTSQLLEDDTADLEVSAAGWVANANVTATYPQRSTAQKLNGVASLLTRASAAADMTVRTTVRYPVTAGVNYRARMWSRPGTTARSFLVYIVYYDAASGGSVMGFSSLNPALEVAGTWTQSYNDGAAPVGATHAQPYIDWLACGAGEDHYVDAARLGDTAPEVLYDYLVPRDAPAGTVTWRARGVRYLTVPVTNINDINVSGWSTPVTTTLLGNGTTWFKSPTDPTFNIGFAHEDTAFASSSSEIQSIYDPEGQRGYTVHRTTIHGEMFEFHLYFPNDRAWLAFEALRNRQEPLLFQSCYGDSVLEQYWVSLGPTRVVTRVTTTDQGISQRRRVVIGGTEVEAPV